MSALARALAAAVLLVATTGGALLVSAAPAAACSCTQPSAELLDTHDVVFSGVVTDRRESGGAGIVTLRIDRVFKGDVTRRVDVVDEEPDSTCGLDAEVGADLVVFGRLVDTEVTSNLCLTVTANDGAYDQVLADLGEGTAPSPGYMKAERRTLGLTYEQFSAGRAILGVLGLSALAYFVLKAWRARRRTS